MVAGCHCYAAKQWLSTRPGASSVLLGSPAVEVRSAGEGRGLGLFATRSIPAFTQLLSNAPLILMKPGEDLPELYQQFTNLSKDDQATYLDLSYHDNPARDALLKDKLLRRGFGEEGLGEMAKVAGIMQTNAFNVDLQDGKGCTHRALFANIARVNHSCAPNAHVCFYPPSESGAKGRMVVHALRALQPDDEVLISYFNILLPRTERQQKAQKWGFQCRCRICEESSSDHSHFERQRQMCRDFTAKQAHIMGRARATKREINVLSEKGVSIAKEAEACPELHPALPDLYDGLGMLQAALHVQKVEEKRQDVVAFLEKAAIWEACITGPQSPASVRRLEKVAQFAARRSANKVPNVISSDDGGYELRWVDG